MRPIYVQFDHITPDHITYSRTESEAVLAVGSYRLAVSSNDLSQLREAAALFRKVREEGERAHRDVLARIAFLEQQEKHRAMAPAVTQTTPEPGGLFRRPCSCGASNDPRLVHRLDGPCHPATQEVQPCPTCNGNGCADCAGHGLALVHTQQLAPAEVYQFPQAQVDTPAGPPMRHVHQFPQEPGDIPQAPPTPVPSPAPVN